MRIARTAVVVALVVVVAGCAGMRAKPKAMIAREGALTRGETLQYLGVDFSRAVFYDPYLRYDDTVHGKIPSWSQHALEDEAVKFPLPLTNDFTTSEQLNKKVAEKAFVTTTPDAAKLALSDSVLQKELAPYVDKKKSGHALLIVCEQISKPAGVVAHYAVFDRRSGEVVLLDQVVGEAGGFGPHNYYLNGLKAVATHARKNIDALVR